MKKTLVFPILLAAIFSKAQTNFCLSPTCLPIKAITTDTVVLSFGLTTSDGYKSIVFSQVSGPSTATLGPSTVAYNTGLQATATAKIWNTVPGTYVFRISGASNGGSTGSAIDSVIVSAPPVAAAPRTVVQVTYILVNGVWTAKFLYNDGSVQ
jgi:hypothetical protein